ncbi:hypothetical protein GY45DRAFT_699941 [Cubamyces sp. BRFM 1775]|nr:hypothetical protein GY45DRAFT_699941 [Cubamyces sp. BRFM 1775]
MFPGNTARLHVRPKCAEPRDATRANSSPVASQRVTTRRAHITQPHPTSPAQAIASRPPDTQEKSAEEGKALFSGQEPTERKKRGESRSPRRHVFQAFYACAPRVTGLPNRGPGSAVTHPRGRVSEVRRLVLRRRCRSLSVSLPGRHRDSSSRHGTP